LHDEQRLLADQLDRGAPLRDVAADLAWASAAKAPDVRLEALHWRRGVMALEVRGGKPPFEADSGRPVERSRRPLRPGVWVWGVGPEGGAQTAGSANPEDSRP
jgi:hypothetical protein